MTTTEFQDMLADALALLRVALDLFHGEHELCDEVDSREWLWRFRTLYLLDATQEATSDHPTD